MFDEYQDVTSPIVKNLLELFIAGSQLSPGYLNSKERKESRKVGGSPGQESDL